MGERVIAFWEGFKRWMTSDEVTLFTVVLVFLTLLPVGRWLGLSGPADKVFSLVTPLLIVAVVVLRRRIRTRSS